MTYSEVREMYSLEMAAMVEERERARKALRRNLQMVFGWLIPSLVTAMTVVLGLKGNMLNASITMSVAAMNTLTFVLWRQSRNEEPSYRLFVSAFTWLVAVAAAVAI